MKRVVIAAAVVATVVGSTVGAAGSSGSGGAYERARTWETPLGQVYGPVHAGAEASDSYGFVVK